MTDLTPEGVRDELNGIAVNASSRERAIESWFKLRTLHTKMDLLRRWLEPSDLAVASEALDFAHEQLRFAMLENDPGSTTSGGGTERRDPGSAVAPSGSDERTYSHIQNRLEMAHALYCFVADKAVECEKEGKGPR